LMPSLLTRRVRFCKRNMSRIIVIVGAPYRVPVAMD
jgi:hypothetical protein